MKLFLYSMLISVIVLGAIVFWFALNKSYYSTDEIRQPSVATDQRDGDLTPSSKCVSDSDCVIASWSVCQCSKQVAINKQYTNTLSVKQGDISCEGIYCYINEPLEGQGIECRGVCGMSFYSMTDTYCKEGVCQGICEGVDGSITECTGI